jgi:predicted lactoylglutathione lyase
MVVSEAIYVMLLTHDKFRQFTPKRIADARETSEVLLCLSAGQPRRGRRPDRQGGRRGRQRRSEPEAGYGFMYGRSFEDPDGHIWEVMWMDVEAAMAQAAKRRRRLSREPATAHLPRRTAMNHAATAPYRRLFPAPPPSGSDGPSAAS